jgi:hypothetical protein
MGSEIASGAATVARQALGTAAKVVGTVADKLGPQGRFAVGAGAVGAAVSTTGTVVGGWGPSTRDKAGTVAGITTFATLIPFGVAANHLRNTPPDLAGKQIPAKLAVKAGGAVIAASIGAWLTLQVIDKVAPRAGVKPQLRGPISPNNPCLVYAPDGSGRKKAICTNRPKSATGDVVSTTSAADKSPSRSGTILETDKVKIVYAPDGSNRKKAIFKP